MKPRTIEEWMRDKERDADPASRRRRALIPAVFHDLTWADLKDNARVAISEDETASAKKMLKAYADEWEDVKADADGLVLVGPPGWGKTMGAALTAMDIIDQGGWVRFISYAELVARETNLYQLAREAERQNDWGDHEKEELRLDWIKWECDLLVLDDVGKERRSSSDLASDLLERLLRRRVTDRKCTIITTNLSMEQWATYNASMESFLWTVGDVLEYVKGEDLRSRVERPTRVSRRCAAR